MKTGNHIKSFDPAKNISDFLWKHPNRYSISNNWHIQNCLCIPILFQSARNYRLAMKEKITSEELLKKYRYIG